VCIGPAHVNESQQSNTREGQPVFAQKLHFLAARAMPGLCMAWQLRSRFSQLELAFVFFSRAWQLRSSFPCAILLNHAAHGHFVHPDGRGRAIHRGFARISTQRLQVRVPVRDPCSASHGLVEAKAARASVVARIHIGIGALLSCILLWLQKSCDSSLLTCTAVPE